MIAHVLQHAQFFYFRRPLICRPVNLSTCLSVNLSTCQHVDLSTCQHVDLSTCRPVDLSTCRPVDLSTCQPFYLSTCRPVDLSTCRPVNILLAITCEQYTSDVLSALIIVNDSSLPQALRNTHICCVSVPYVIVY